MMTPLITAFLLIVTGMLLRLISKLVPFIRDVRLMRRAVVGLPSLPNHWILGTFPTVKKVGHENFLNFLLEMTRTRRVKTLVFWKTCLQPYVMCVHPETAGEILRSSEPKNRALGGGYNKLLPWLGEGLLISTNPKWERNRKFLTPAFHFNILRPYVEIYNTAAKILLDKFQKAAATGMSYDIFGPVGQYTLDVMLKCSCSYDGGIQYQGVSHPYVQAVTRLTHLAEELVMSPLQYFDTLYKLTRKGREFKRLCNYVHQFSEDIIEKRRETLLTNENPSTKRHLDFLDILLKARDENGVGLSKQDIRSEVDTFLFEAHDTTASAISWSLFALAKHPNVQEKVYQDVSKVMGEKNRIDWNFDPRDLQKTHFLHVIHTPLCHFLPVLETALVKTLR